MRITADCIKARVCIDESGVVPLFIREPFCRLELCMQCRVIANIALMPRRSHRTVENGCGGGKVGGGTAVGECRRGESGAEEGGGGGNGGGDAGGKADTSEADCSMGSGRQIGGIKACRPPFFPLPQLIKRVFRRVRLEPSPTSKQEDARVIFI